MHRSGIAGLRIDRPSVEDVGTALDDLVHVVGIAEGDEAKASRTAGLGVLHHHTVDHFTKPVVRPASSMRG